MNICYVYQDQYPWDVRIEKMTESLAAAGHDVRIVSRNRTGVAARERVTARIQIYRVAQGFDRFSRALLNFPGFFSPAWIRKTMSVVKDQGADLIIVRDLPLAPMAIWVARMTGTPVIMDMAENYPAMIQDTWSFRGPRPIDYVIRNPSVLRKMEQWVLPRLDGILVVSEESAARIRPLARGDALVSVVGNTPRLRSSATRYSHPLVDRLRKRFDVVLLYVGGMEETRGLEVVIRSLTEVVRHRPGFLFVIVGQGTAEPKLRQLVRDRALEKNVLFAGWLDPMFVPSVVAESDMCIVPHYVTEHTDTTIPNKIFDYMVQKKPVIVTNAQSLRHLVESRRCGKVYADRDAAALARAILDLASPEERRTLGDAGFRAVQTGYNWERDAEILLEAVRAVVDRHTGAAQRTGSDKHCEAAGSAR